jgi:hypothetical protein
MPNDETTVERTASESGPQQWIEVPTLEATPQRPNLWAQRTVQDGVRGYVLNVRSERVFLPERSADELGRYFLFGPDVRSES